MNIWKCGPLMNTISQDQLIDFMYGWQQPSDNLANPKLTDSSNECTNKAYPCIIWVNDVTIYSIKFLWMKQNNGICIINENHINFMRCDQTNVSKSMQSISIHRRFSQHWLIWYRSKYFDHLNVYNFSVENWRNQLFEWSKNNFLTKKMFVAVHLPHLFSRINVEGFY